MRRNIKAMAYLSILTGGLICGSANAGNISTFIPDEPQIESPLSDSEDVSKTPKIEGNLSTARDRDGGSTPIVDIVTSEWMVFKASESIQLVGGNELTRLSSIEDVPSIVMPFPLENVDFDGQDVASMEIGQFGYVKFKDAAGVVLAEVDARITNYWSMALDPNRAYIAVHTSDHRVTIQWYQKNTDGAGTTWTNTAEALITSSSQLGLRFSNDSLNSDIYTLTGGEVGCSVVLDAQYPSMITTLIKTLPEWKTSFTTDVRTEFSLICSEDFISGELSAQVFEDSTPTELILPAIQNFESSNTEYTLTEEQALEPNTEYSAQVRYIVKESSDVNELPFTQTSQWSQPVNFTTVPPQVDYVVTAPDTTTFTIDTPTQVEISLENTGTETGRAVVEILLPLNFLSELNGSLSDFYAASVEGAASSCSVSLVSNETLISCTVDALAPGESVDYTATLTMTDTSQNQFKYRVCDDSVCDEAEYTAVSISVISERTGDGEGDDDTGGSGGGAVLYLLALAGLIRRRV